MIEFDRQFMFAVLAALLIIVFIVFLMFGVARLLIPRSSIETVLEESEDGHFYAAGRRIDCVHCGESTFTVSQVLLNTWLLSLLRIDFLDDSASVLTCKKCGRQTWFSQASRSMDE